MNTVFIILLFMIIALSFKRNTARPSVITLDKMCTSELKGIAIISVVLGHLVITKFIDTPFQYFNYLGAQGVTLFVFLSGFGLTTTVLVQGISKGFLKRRLSVVLIPYALTTSLWIIIDALLGRYYALKTIGLSILGLSLTIDATMWYISFISIWYIVFFLSFYQKIPNAVRLLILFGFAWFLRSGNLAIVPVDFKWQWRMYSLVFPLGVLLAFYLWHKIRQTQSNGLVFIGSLGFVYFAYSLFSQRNDMFYTNFNICVAMLLVVVIVLLNMYGYESTLLKTIGDFSYEIYLCEAVFMYKFSFLYLSSNKLLGFTLYIISLAVFSVALKSVMKWITHYGAKRLTKPSISQGF